MQQPDLGKKIAELRKAKGLTQEELVDLCNISVRTIQRIETGEVMPRSYTVKTILSALDYDLKKMQEEEDGTKQADDSAFSESFSAQIQNGGGGNYLKQLNLAWIFGIAYFVLGFFEAAAEYSRYSDNEMIFGTTPYIIIKIVVLVSYVFFLSGFFVLGKIFDNYLLKIMSMVLIAATFLIISYDIASLYFEFLSTEVIMVGAPLLYGSAGLIFGMALTRLEKHLGLTAKLAGIFEIIVAVCFLTVVLSLVGLIFQVPAELFGIILIFKARELLKSRESKKSLA